MIQAQASCVPLTLHGTQLLSDGTTTSALAVSESLWLHVKVYSSGGENSFHEHPDEDHAFVVLQGAARFETADGAAWELAQYDGLLVPRGVFYRFESGADENLVLLRAGGGVRDHAIEQDPDFPSPMMARFGTDSRPQAGDAPENRTASRPPVPLPGRTFGR